MMPSLSPLCSRREALRRVSTGFGLLAFSALMKQQSYAGLAFKPGPQFPPKAKNVIFCYMSGGVSHVDSFDPKPRLAAEAGQPMPMPVARTQFNNNGKIMPSPWAFKQYGECG